MRKRYVLVPISLLVGLTYILWDGRDDTPVSEVPRTSSAAEEPDFYGDQLIRRQFDAEGRLAQTFTAKRSEHYPTSETTRFQTPHVIAVNSQGKTWQIDASKGEMSDKEQVLTLIDNVEIRPIDDVENSDLLVETSRLNYQLKAQIAQTDEPVQITNPNTNINAVGMTLNVPAQTLELSKQVNTRYAPPPSE